MNVVLNGRVCRPESGALLEDLRQFARVCGKVSVTYKEYRLAGRFYPTIFVRRFGSWNNALVAAGLEPCKLFNVSAEVLLENLEELWVALGRQPVMADLVQPLSRFGRRPYVRVFGSWGAAVKAAASNVEMRKCENVKVNVKMCKCEDVKIGVVGDTLRQSGFSLTPALPLKKRDTSSKGEGGVMCDNSDTLRQSGDCHPLRRKQSLRRTEVKLSDCNNLKIVSKRATPREPGWRLRYMVLKRDLFRCVACGASPATNVGTVLHVDHIVAYSIGGESVMENLQTLCEVCNGGKSNL